MRRLEVDDVFVSPPTPVENPTPSETDSGSILSRRQKRNRSKKKVVKKKTEKQAPKKVEVKAQSRKTTPLKYYSRLRMSKMELYNYLSKYVLSDDQLLNLGYPVESAFCPEKAIIYKSPEANITYYSNGQLSELTDRFYEDERHWLSQKRPPLSPSLEKRCVRCRKGFFVTQDGEYLTEESCTYHWGTWKKTSDTCGYTCCQGDSKSGGCSTGKFHVWNGVSPGMNGPFNGYARTRSCPSDSAHCDVYALDCEMCYTGLGLEVCKVTVISTDGCLVYETLVKPDRPVVDYNTRFSGLNASHLDSTKKRLRDVQKDLLRLIYTETILIGHGLENDLRALGLLHPRVIDTAVLFPHYYGFPFRRSLKSLVSTYLRRDIQVGRDGHDSYEDARACAELVLWKATRELRLKSETLEKFPVLN